MVAIPLILLAATVTIFSTVSEDVFARERYSGDSTSQAAAVSNDCLNPILDSNTIDNIVGVGNCGGTISQMDEQTLQQMRDAAAFFTCTCTPDSD